MIERYLKIKAKLPCDYSEIADLVPNARENLLLEDLYNNVLTGKLLFYKGMEVHLVILLSLRYRRHAILV